MSDNTGIQITELRAGGWEVRRYSMDTGQEVGRASVGLYGSLDAALDRVHTMESEYGLEIVRLKDVCSCDHTGCCL